CEQILERGTSVFSDGYMGDATTIPAPPAQQQAPAKTANSIRQALGGDFVFGDLVQPQVYQKLLFCAQTKTELAELRVNFGRNFIRTEKDWDSFYGFLGFPS